MNLNLWLLIIDTKGINVWCAAGKGTFSEQAILKAMKQTKLETILENKILILPQLGAPGVSAHIITKYTNIQKNRIIRVNLISPVFFMCCKFSNPFSFGYPLIITKPIKEFIFLPHFQ